MSPVFRHGRLRLYLLKLLDEAPRHGYEIIRMLQDRFLGVYAPSPGTIYPRLARLEEEGLVTHDEVDGRKVYRITEKGREELRSRLDDLAELEDTITASVRDIAREVTEDVRETVRSLREELASAVRDVQSGSGSGTRREPGRGQRPAGRPEEPAAGAEAGHGATWQRATEEEAAGARPGAAEEERAAGTGRQARGGRGRGGRRWGHSEGGPDWGDWSGWPGWAGRGWSGPGGCADPHTYRDLERLARQFTRDLRAAAAQAQAVSEDAVHDLRQILDEAIGRIKDEVFAQRPRREEQEPTASGGGEESPGHEPGDGTPDDQAERPGQ
jgi:DNA-binding PadR family transcriptional regulator